MESNHFKPVHRDLKGGKKPICKAMINTRKSKRTNMKMLKMDIKSYNVGKESKKI